MRVPGRAAPDRTIQPTAWLCAYRSRGGRSLYDICGCDSEVLEIVNWTRPCRVLVALAETLPATPDDESGDEDGDERASEAGSVELG